MYENDIEKLKRIYSNYLNNGQLTREEETHTIKCTDTSHGRMANDDFILILKCAYTMTSTDKKDVDIADILSTYYMEQGTEVLAKIIELENAYTGSRDNLCAIKVKSKTSPDCFVTLPDPLYYLTEYEKIKTAERSGRNVDNMYETYAKELTESLRLTVETNKEKTKRFTNSKNKDK